MEEGTPECETMKQIISAFNDAYRQLPAYQKNIAGDEDALVNGFQEIAHLLHKHGTPGASEYLRGLGYGAYKECYEFIPAKIVVKFISNRNETDKEAQIRANACEAGIGPLFLPSFSANISQYRMELQYITYAALADWDMECTLSESTEDTPPGPYYAELIAFQPYATPIAVDEEEFPPVFTEVQYNRRALLLDNITIPWDAFQRFRIDCPDWVQLVYDVYGAQFLHRFLTFIEERDINDLSVNNLGYYLDSQGNKIPVIIDWLSDCHAEKKVRPSD